MGAGRRRLVEVPALVQTAVQWGDMRDWDEVPADLAFKLQGLRNAHDVFAGLRSAGAQNRAVEWARQHPQAWEFASAVMYERRAT